MMTTLSQKLRIILERRHEILVSEFQKALNIAFKRGDKIEDACRYAFIVTHPITNEHALKEMTKIYSDIFYKKEKT